MFLRIAKQQRPRGPRLLANPVFLSQFWTKAIRPNELRHWRWAAWSKHQACFIPFDHLPHKKKERADPEDGPFRNERLLPLDCVRLELALAAARYHGQRQSARDHRPRRRLGNLAPSTSL